MITERGRNKPSVTGEGFVDKDFQYINHSPAKMRGIPGKAKGSKSSDGDALKQAKLVFTSLADLKTDSKHRNEIFTSTQESYEAFEQPEPKNIKFAVENKGVESVELHHIPNSERKFTNTELSE